MRAVVFSLLLLSIATTATISLPYLYQKSVDRFFSDTLTAAENLLIIHTKGDWLSASGAHKQIYHPLLSKELGAYQSHRYLGWHTSYQYWKRDVGIPFTLMYEVTYDNATIHENFYFSGGFPGELLIREITLSTGQNL